MEEEITFNYTKYLDKNPLQKLLIGHFYRTLLFMLKDLKLKKVLDVGCGEGILLAKLKSNKIGSYLEGVDSSKQEIVLAKKLYPNLNLKIGDIYKLPYRSSSFDLVTCTEVLEHLKNPELALSELRRVSAKYVLISVPNEPIFRIANLLRGRYVTVWGNTPGHIQHWSKRQFVAFVERGKFKVISVKSPFPWTLVLSKKN